MGAAQPKPEAAEGEDDYQHIDTGDSLKVKQILDEATVKAVLAKGYDEVHFIDNLKISLMIIACLFACAAQFNPIPFPRVRPILGVCCGGYFWEAGFAETVQKMVAKFEAKKKQ